MRINTFRGKIVCSAMLLLTGVLLLVNVVNHALLSSVLETRAAAQRTSRVRAVADAFDGFLVQRRKTIAEFFAQQDSLLEAYHAALTSVQRGQLARDLNASVLRFCQANPSIAYACFYFTADNRIVANTRMNNVALEALPGDMTDAQQSGMSMLPSLLLGDYLFNPTDAAMIACVSIRHMDGADVVMLCVLNPATATGETDQFAVYDQDGEWLWETSAFSQEESELDDSIRHAASGSAWQYQIKLEAPVQPTEMLRYARRQKLLSGCALLVAFCSVAFFSRRIMRPIRELATRIEAVDSFGGEQRVTPMRAQVSLSLHAHLQILLVGHVLVPALIVQVFLSLFFSHALYAMVERTTLDDARGVASRTAQYLDDVCLLINDVALSSPVQEALTDSMNGAQSVPEIQYPLTRIASANIQRINILDSGQQRIASNAPLSQTALLPDPLPEGTFSFESSKPVWRWMHDYADLQYIVTKNVRRRIPTHESEWDDRESFYQTIGYMEAVIPGEVLTSLYSPLIWDDAMHAMILSEDDTIVSSPSEFYVGMPFQRLLDDAALQRDSNSHLFHEIAIGREGWRLLLVTPRSAWTSDNVYGVLFNLAMFTGLLVIIWLLSYYFASRIMRPISTLQARMALVQTGDFGVRNEIQQRGSEIDQLYEAFNHMMDRLQTLVEENYLSERNKKETELIALQSQINPHFIYNTISSISFMISMGHLDDAIEMLSALSRLFRVGMYRGSVIVRLGEEIEHVEAYLKIQKLRYREKLTYTIEVPEAMNNYGFIKLTLQPLVENAVYHGLEAKKGPGHILIRGEADPKRGTLSIIITDDGIGITPVRLAAIREGMADESFGEHIGIMNVLKRIRLYYGSNYGLEIESTVDKGTCITLCIPLIHEW